LRKILHLFMQLQHKVVEAYHRLEGKRYDNSIPNSI
jgi:hypothetical protein